MPTIAAPDTLVSSIQAHLTVSLCPEGPFIAGEDALADACRPEVRRWRSLA
jgi:hypothetical protein